MAQSKQWVWTEPPPLISNIKLNIASFWWGVVKSATRLSFKWRNPWLTLAMHLPLGQMFPFQNGLPCFLLITFPIITNFCQKEATLLSPHDFPSPGNHGTPSTPDYSWTSQHARIPAVTTKGSTCTLESITMLPMHTTRMLHKAC